MKERIVYEYVESSSTMTMVGLGAIFAGLAFTFYKVNKLVNKAHMFWLSKLDCFFALTFALLNAFILMRVVI